MEGKNHFRTVWTQTPLFSGGNIVSVALPTKPLDTMTPKNTKVESAISTAATMNNDTQQTHIMESTSEELSTMEALVMVCGDVVNLVAASTGDLLCSYKLPVEDVILHIDAVSHIRRNIDLVQIKKEMHNDDDEDEKKKTNKKLLSTDGEEGQKAKVNIARATSQGVDAENNNNIDKTKTNETERKKRSRKRKRNATLDQNADKTVNDEANQNNNNNKTTKNKKLVTGLWDNNPEDVPLGVYVAVATRSLQIYLLRVDTINSYVGEEHNDENDDDNGSGVHSQGKLNKENEENMKNVENVNVKTNTARQDAEFTNLNITFEFHLLRNWTAAQQAISMVYFTPLSSLLVSASTDGNVKVWNPFHHYLTHNLHNTHATVITSVFCDAAESLLVIGDVEGHVTLFDFVNKRVRAAARPHVQAIVGLYITNFNSTSSSQNGKSEKESGGVYVYSVSQDRKLAMLQLTNNVLREVRSIVLREQVTACCFEDESTLHVGALDGGVMTYSLHPSEPVQVICQLPAPSHDVENEQDTESSVRSLIVSEQYKGYLTQMGGFIVDAPETLCEYKSRSLYVADAGFNIACLRKKEQVYSSTSNTIKDANNANEKAITPSTKNNVEVTKPIYHVVYTLVGYLGQILDLKMLPSITKQYNNDKEHESKAKNGHNKEIETKETSMEHLEEEEQKPAPSLASMQRLIVTNSKDVRLFPSTGCRSTHCLQGHSDIVMCCAVNREGTLIATAGKDTTIRF